ncbi:MAG: hypothetical protein JNL01_05990 [Bdellovibrionales bacterium]|nr:hypothetical protein [Bdellovibrionales bacterium]
MKAFILASVTLLVSQQAYAQLFSGCGGWDDCNCHMNTKVQTSTGSTVDGVRLQGTRDGSVQPNCDRGYCARKCAGGAFKDWYAKMDVFRNQACQANNIMDLKVVVTFDATYDSGPWKTETIDCKQKFVDMFKTTPPTVRATTLNGATATASVGTSFSGGGTFGAYMQRTLTGAAGGSLSTAQRCPASTRLVRLADGSFRCDTSGGNGIAANRGSRAATSGSAPQQQIVNNTPVYSDPTPTQTQTPTCNYVCSGGTQLQHEVSIGCKSNSLLALIFSAVGPSEAQALYPESTQQTCSWQCPAGATPPGGYVPTPSYDSGAPRMPQEYIQ